MGVNAVLGFVLIVMAFIIFVIATPALHDAIDTSPGSPLENETEAVKQIYSTYDILIPVIPLAMFVAGAALFMGRD